MHSPELLFIGNLFSSDMLIIMLVALMLFGGEKLPEIARGLGKGIRDFKDASEGIKREINEQINSFEVKETKKIPENTSSTPADQNPQDTVAEKLLANNNPVQNTVPVTEDHFSENEHTTDVNNHDAHVEVAAENDPASTHAHSTPIPGEPIKNS